MVIQENNDLTCCYINKRIKKSKKLREALNTVVKDFFRLSRSN